MYTADMRNWLTSMHQILGTMLPSLFFDKVDADIIRRNPPFLNLIQESGYMHIQATKPDTVGRYNVWQNI